MSYGCWFTKKKITLGVLPCSTSSNTGERSKTFTSFNVPGHPKNACQIYISWDATASSITVEVLLSLRVNWHSNAGGQFFNFQCMQSILPIIPENPPIPLTCKFFASHLQLELWDTFAHTTVWFPYKIDASTPMMYVGPNFGQLGK